MNKIKFVYAVAALLILLFVYTATSKLIDFAIFRAQLQLSPLIKDGAYILAPLIILVELVVSLLLLFGATRKAGLIGSVTLLSAFTIYLAIGLTTGIELPCTCGGVIAKMSWTQHVLFNCVFIALSISAIIFSSKTEKPLPDRQYVHG